MYKIKIASSSRHNSITCQLMSTQSVAQLKVNKRDTLYWSPNVSGHGRENKLG